MSLFLLLGAGELSSLLSVSAGDGVVSYLSSSSFADDGDGDASSLPLILGALHLLLMGMDAKKSLALVPNQIL